MWMNGLPQVSRCGPRIWEIRSVGRRWPRLSSAPTEFLRVDSFGSIQSRPPDPSQAQLIPNGGLTNRWSRPGGGRAPGRSEAGDARREGARGGRGGGGRGGGGGGGGGGG